MTKFLGIDHGTKRVGVAVGDDEFRLAAPVTTVDVTGSADSVIHAIAELANDYQIDVIVIGLPLNMDGSEGPQAKLTREFGASLSARLDLPVEYFDERLTSIGADELLAPAELTRKKKRKRIDRVAAQLILQGYLDQGHREASD